MSSANEPINIVIKKNCVKCKVCFMNLFKCFNNCYPSVEKKENDTVQLSNTDFNKKRTPSMSDYVVNSYLNKKSSEEISDKPKDINLEVPDAVENIVRV